jgi:hypothetical protein
MTGKLLVDFRGTPIRGLPCLESVPKFFALLALHPKESALAAGIQYDASFRIKSEAMPAGKMMQPASIHLELGGPAP